MQYTERSKEEITGEHCMLCGNDALTLRETLFDIPDFGPTYVFSMDCQECDYEKSDVEAAQEKEGAEYTLDVEAEGDLKIPVVKSSHATVKVLRMGSMEPGEASSGYITNVQGLLQKFKEVVQAARDEADGAERKKAKNQLKKLDRVLMGRDSVTVRISDPTGNSAIIDDKVDAESL
jgi:zinc finger protein